MELLDYLICDGLDEIAKSSFAFIEESGKPQILLTWITYASIIYGSTVQQESVDDILMKVQQSRFNMFTLKLFFKCNI